MSGLGQPLDLAAQVLDLRTRRLQLLGQIVRLGDGGIPVGGEDPEIGVDSLQVFVDLCAVVPVLSSEVEA
ncbi:hypothetical protein ACFQ0O_32135 [Saccharopolyspora spinosporotrichia]